MKIAVIIAAGGTGKRMGRPKQFLPLAGRAVVEWTIEVFRKVKDVDQIILVVSGEDLERAKNLGVKVVEGGEERGDSVKNGLKAISPDCDLVIIQDGARPLITPDIIEKAIGEAQEHGAVVVGVPVKDTIKKVERGALIVERSLDRDELWHAQTPQIFRYDIITRAYAKRASATDDAKLVEDLGIKVKMVMGSYENIKITTPEDVIVAEAILRNRNVLPK
ncbi:2-C-methyl-D-erythritol 4-phosphate cytidylyltransferase [Candidatus Saganbacteria bacterium]|nr:2-C-methyl-D-erythritol 4-phosphate cytidylyltransferase [Candidatus Saganbacteria bacterium]